MCDRTMEEMDRESGWFREGQKDHGRIISYNHLGQRCSIKPEAYEIWKKIIEAKKTGKTSIEIDLKLLGRFFCEPQNEPAVKSQIMDSTHA